SSWSVRTWESSRPASAPATPSSSRCSPSSLTWTSIMTSLDNVDADTATLSESNAQDLPSERGGACIQLELVWSKAEGHRLGECCIVSRAAVLGRGPASDPGDAPKAEFFRQRPGVNEPTGALTAPTISRRQWLMTPQPNALEVENVGKQQLLHNGVVTSRCVAR